MAVGIVCAEAFFENDGVRIVFEDFGEGCFEGNSGANNENLLEGDGGVIEKVVDVPE